MRSSRRDGSLSDHLVIATLGPANHPGLGLCSSGRPVHSAVVPSDRPPLPASGLSRRAWSRRMTLALALCGPSPASGLAAFTGGTMPNAPRRTLRPAARVRQFLNSAIESVWCRGRAPNAGLLFEVENRYAGIATRPNMPVSDTTAD